MQASPIAFIGVGKSRVFGAPATVEDRRRPARTHLRAPQPVSWKLQVLRSVEAVYPFSACITTLPS